MPNFLNMAKSWFSSMANIPPDQVCTKDLLSWKLYPTLLACYKLPILKLGLAIRIWNPPYFWPILESESGICFFLLADSDS